MSSRLDVQLIVKVAQMYYLDGLKQEEIAKQIGISRSLISMILTEAKERGIVEIAVRDPFLNDEELSGALGSHYPQGHLHGHPDLVPRAHGPAQAGGAAGRRHPGAQPEGGRGARAGLGPDLPGAGERLPPARTSGCGCRWCPSSVAARRRRPYFQINELVRVLAERGGGTPYFIHAPALVADRKERDLYVNGSAMQPIRQRWKKMDVLVTSIGALGGDHPDRESYLGEGEAQRDVRERDAAGDLSARYFDHRGRFIADDFYERVVGVPVEDLRAAKSAVCMASGVDKADAIVAALEDRRAAKQLIMDEPTARAALELMRPGERTELVDLGLRGATALVTGASRGLGRPSRWRWRPRGRRGGGVPARAGRRPSEAAAACRGAGAAPQIRPAGGRLRGRHRGPPSPRRRAASASRPSSSTTLPCARAVPTVGTTREGFDGVLAVNLTGAFLCCRELLRRLGGAKAGADSERGLDGGLHRILQRAAGGLRRVQGRPGVAHPLAGAGGGPAGSDRERPGPRLHADRHDGGEVRAPRPERYLERVPLGRLGTLDEVAAAASSWPPGRRPTSPAPS